MDIDAKHSGHFVNAIRYVNYLGSSIRELKQPSLQDIRKNVFHKYLDTYYLCLRYQ